MSDDPYCYPGTSVLRNRLGITDAARLDYHEREITTQRAAQGVPSGEFDLKHLQAVHRHLFQDIYEWAGQLRTVEMSKGGSPFQPTKYLETGMADVHRRLVAADYLKGLSPTRFAEAAGKIIGDVNHVHPFREGNGRTQLLYLKQLASCAGHRLELRRIDREAWMEASRRAHEKADYAPMSQAIAKALEPQQQQSWSRRTDQERER